MEPLKASIGMWKNPKESVTVVPAADIVSLRAMTLTEISFALCFSEKMLPAHAESVSFPADRLVFLEWH